MPEGGRHAALGIKEEPKELVVRLVVTAQDHSTDYALPNDRQFP